jgi:hypothetical protein
LVLLPPQRDERFLLVPAPETFSRDLGFAGGDHGDFLLVLLELVALDFHLVDRPISEL